MPVWRCAGLVRWLRSTSRNQSSCGRCRTERGRRCGGCRRGCQPRGPAAAVAMRGCRWNSIDDHAAKNQEVVGYRGQTGANSVNPAAAARARSSRTRETVWAARRMRPRSLRVKPASVASWGVTSVARVTTSRRWRSWSRPLGGPDAAAILMRSAPTRLGRGMEARLWLCSTSTRSVRFKACVPPGVPITDRHDLLLEPVIPQDRVDAAHTRTARAEVHHNV